MRLAPQVIFLLFSIDVVYSDRATELPCSFKGNGYHYECSRNITSGNECGDDPIRVAWDYVDLDAGVVNVTILGQLCVHKYQLALCSFENSEFKDQIETGKTITMMKNSSGCMEKGATPHSFREINQNKKNSIPCQEMQNVTFRNIYTGVYMLDVIQVGLFSKYYSLPVHFKTNIRRESLLNRTLSIQSWQGNSGDKIVNIHHEISNFRQLGATRLTLKTFHSTDSANCTSEGEKNMKIITIEPHMNCINVTDEKLHCQLSVAKNDTIECTSKNVDPGFHWIYVEVVSDMCPEPKDVWSDVDVRQCKLCGNSVSVMNPIVQSVDSSQGYTAPFHQLWTLLIVVVLLLIVIMAAIVIFLHRRPPADPINDYKSNLEEIDVIGHDPTLLPAHPQIYLMYSRDCHAFMDVMSWLRVILKKALDCEVYDCYDDNYFEEIARCGTSWPGKHVTNDNVKVVLVESKCATMHLQAHMDNLKISYQQPMSWDDLFMFGLKTLFSNPQFNSYDKVFVVRIGGFTGEEDMFINVTPYTRYVIPTAIKHLLLSISQQYNLTLSSGWETNLHHLREAVENLNNYITSDPDYLEKLLVRKQASGFRKLVSRFKI